MHVTCLVEPSASPEDIALARTFAQMRLAGEHPPLAWSDLGDPSVVEVEIEGRRLLQLTWSA
jgi:hypothetical protein